MKNVLITGAAGFIGSNLFAKCIEPEQDWSVTGVDDLSNGHVNFIDDMSYTSNGPKDHSLIIDDFASKSILRNIKNRKYDIVFHLAAIPRVSYSVEHPLLTSKVNINSSLALINACIGNVEKFIFASSSSVYGGAELLPTREVDPKDPKSPYALQKLVIEDHLRLYSKLYKFDSAILRFFNVFGKNQLGDSPYSCAISAWLTAMVKNKTLRFDGDGLQTRDMCHVDNVTDMCIKAANFNGSLCAEAFNVACGDRTSNKDILEYILQKFPNFDKNRIVQAPERLGDVRHTHADISKANRWFGYKPKVNIWEGIDKTAEWAINSPLFSQLKLNT